MDKKHFREALLEALHPKVLDEKTLLNRIDRCKDNVQFINELCASNNIKYRIFDSSYNYVLEVDGIKGSLETNFFVVWDGSFGTITDFNLEGLVNKVDLVELCNKSADICEKYGISLTK